LSIHARDGVLLRGIHLATGARRDLAVVVSHGFTHGVARTPTRELLAALAEHVDVVSVNFRGHGDSGGRCTVGEAERLDVDAAVGWARRAGYQKVASAGFSMGAAVALRHAGLDPEHPADAVVAVSGPSRWWIRETPAMRKVHWLIEQPHGRAVGRLLGVRLAGPWEQVPASPVEVVGRIAPTPLLLVHGGADRYFPTEHARTLRRASRDHAELWVEPGMGHGESGTSPALAGRLARWITRACAPHRGAGAVA
jgi:pimeloyl-ACP methyl ester carboxylesterase